MHSGDVTAALRRCDGRAWWVRRAVGFPTEHGRLGLDLWAPARPRPCRRSVGQCPSGSSLRPLCPASFRHIYVLVVCRSGRLSADTHTQLRSLPPSSLRFVLGAAASFEPPGFSAAPWGVVVRLPRPQAARLLLVRAVAGAPLPLVDPSGRYVFLRLLAALRVCGDGILPPALSHTHHWQRYGPNISGQKEGSPRGTQPSPLCVGDGQDT